MTPMKRRRGEHGSSLLVVLLLSTALAAVVLGTALAIGDEPTAARDFRDRVVLDEAADVALRLTTVALAREADWSRVPGGPFTTGEVDGPPGTRQLPDGRLIDLRTETARRVCGRPTCDDGAITTPTLDRPFGTRNPRWRPVLHRPMSTVDVDAAAICRCYLVAWVADDPADADDDPTRDAPEGVDGHGLLRLRAAAWGPRGGRAEVEALVRAREARVVAWRRVP